MKAASGSVGVLGAGRMGLPIIGAFVDAGRPVSVFDPDASRVAAAVAAGAVALPDPAAVGETAGILVSVLPGVAEAEAAMLSPRGAARALGAGALWLDLTSNDPRVAERIAAVVGERGADAVAAPMAGGVTAAQTRTLGFFVSGAPAAVERARTVLADLGPASGIRVIGDSVPAGYVAKLLANLLWFGQAIAATEALLLGRSLGLPPQQLGSVLAGSAGGSAFLETSLSALLAGDYLESFGIDRVVEELELLVSLADEHAIPFELSSVVTRLHREALERFGAIDGELLGAKLLELFAGVSLHD